ncbi:uncharacterized protein TrAFT101_004096 [Trichoderma asperellum]|uniref:uncharacterized protein n=1 Tax=Trichoderma asperellum TaxID=101201 RepID=UPI00331FF802|nr:hypothetical protein TrAFT101_004096 [Trichoderma asperellum]
MAGPGVDIISAVIVASFVKAESKTTETCDSSRIFQPLPTGWWSVRMSFTRCLFFARPRSQEPPADVTSSTDAAIAHRLLANEGLFALPYDPWRSSCHLGAFSCSAAIETDSLLCAPSRKLASHPPFLRRDRSCEPLCAVT